MGIPRPDGRAGSKIFAVPASVEAAQTEAQRRINNILWNYSKSMSDLKDVSHFRSTPTSAETVIDPFMGGGTTILTVQELIKRASHAKLRKQFQLEAESFLTAMDSGEAVMDIALKLARAGRLPMTGVYYPERHIAIERRMISYNRLGAGTHVSLAGVIHQVGSGAVWIRVGFCSRAARKLFPIGNFGAVDPAHFVEMAPPPVAQSGLPVLASPLRGNALKLLNQAKAQDRLDELTGSELGRLLRKQHSDLPEEDFHDSKTDERWVRSFKKFGTIAAPRRAR